MDLSEAALYCGLMGPMIEGQVGCYTANVMGWWTHYGMSFKGEVVCREEGWVSDDDGRFVVIYWDISGVCGCVGGRVG